jgi:hypothetical protein
MEFQSRNHIHHLICPPQYVENVFEISIDKRTATYTLSRIEITTTFKLYEYRRNQEDPTNRI